MSLQGTLRLGTGPDARRRIQQVVEQLDRHAARWYQVGLAPPALRTGRVTALRSMMLGIPLGRRTAATEPTCCRPLRRRPSRNTPITQYPHHAIPPSRNTYSVNNACHYQPSPYHPGSEKDLRSPQA
jgi:hypothetical protein